MKIVLVPLISLIAAWLAGTVLIMAFARRDRRDTSDTQRYSRTWHWRLKLAAIWPYWSAGIIVWMVRRAYSQRKQKRA